MPKPTREMFKKGERIYSDFETAKEIIKSFLNTDFEGGRHLNRVNKIKEIENANFKEEF